MCELPVEQLSSMDFLPDLITTHIYHADYGAGDDKYINTTCIKICKVVWN